MKKIVCLALMSIMVFLLCACGAESELTNDKMDNGNSNLPSNSLEPQISDEERQDMINSSDSDLVETKMSETEFLEQFDLSDTKISFFNHGIDFYTDRVVVVLKKSVPNLKINLEDFCLNNGERIYLYNFGNYDNPDYRHILTIYLKEHGTEKVIEAAAELNKLEFVRFACPMYIYGNQDDRLIVA